MMSMLNLNNGVNGCNTKYYSTSGTNNNTNYNNVLFEELLSSSDIISIHAPLMMQL